MPGATNELPAPAELIGTRLARLDKADDASLAQRGAVVRAAVSDREILAADIEDADFPALDRHQHALTRRNLLDGCDDVPRHPSSP